MGGNGASHGTACTRARCSIPCTGLGPCVLHLCSKCQHSILGWRRTAAGPLVYEEELSSFLAPTPGSSADNYSLRPGATLTRHIRFVLEAGQVQAVEKVFDGYTSFSPRPGTPIPPR